MRILTMSDFSHRFADGSAPQTGFGRVHYNILTYLHSRGHSVFEAAVGYMGQMIPMEIPWPVYSTNAYGRMEGQDMVPLLANQLNADAILLLADVPDVAYPVMPLEYRDRKQGQPLKDEIIAHIEAGTWKKIAYTVIDGAAPNGHIPRDWHDIFKGFDGIAVATKWGCDLIEKNVGLRPTYLPHMVDTNRFKPTDKTIARSRFGIDPEAFVILGMGVNRKRKMIPSWFETVAKFAEKAEPKKVLFWVHSYNVPEDPGYDLQALSDHYELKKYGIHAITTNKLPEDTVPLAMSAADCGINLSNEGFGLVPLEGAACRIPFFVMDYAGQPEQVTDAMDNFLKVPVKVLIPQPGNVICWGWPDTDIAAERLAEYYADGKLRTKLKRASWEHAQRFSLNNVLPRFEKWLEEIVQREEKPSLTVEVV